MLCRSRCCCLCQGCCQGCARAERYCSHEPFWECPCPGRRAASALLEQASFRLPFSAAKGLACLGCRTEPHRYPTPHPTPPPPQCHPGSFCSKSLSKSCFSQMACVLVHGACCFAFRAYQEPTRVRSVLWLSIAVQDGRIFRRSMLHAAV